MLKYYCAIFYLLFTFAINASEISVIAPISIVEKTEQSSELETNSIESTLNSDQLQLISGSDINDYLLAVPGATTTGGPRGQAELIQIRGLSEDKVFTYVDGHRQNLKSSHTSMLQFDPEMISQVKVQKDNGDITKSGTLGGGIVLKTAEAQDYLKDKKGYGALFKSSFKSTNNERLFHNKYLYQGDKESILLAISKKENNDIKLSNNTKLENSSSDSRYGSMKIQWHPKKDEKLTLSLSGQEERNNSPINPSLNPPTTLADLNGENKIVNNSASIHWREKQIDVQVSYNKQESVKKRISDNKKENKEISSQQAHLHYQSLNNKLLIGAEFIADKQSGKRETHELSPFPSGESLFFTSFGNYTYSISKIINHEIGFKINHYELESKSHNIKRKYLLPQLKTQISMRPLNALNIILAYNEGINPPRIQDVFIDGLHHQGDGFFIADNFFIPNPQLRPEQSKTINLDLKYTHPLERSDALITLGHNRYWSFIKDYIYLNKVDRAIVDEEYGTTQMINIDEVQINGSETFVEYSTESFIGRLNFSKTRGENKSTNKFISNIQADNYQLQLESKIASLGVSLMWQTSLYLRQDRINRDSTERTEETPSYTTHAIALQKTFKNININININNLTNKTYRKHGSNIFEAKRDYKTAIEYKLFF